MGRPKKEAKPKSKDTLSLILAELKKLVLIQKAQVEFETGEKLKLNEQGGS